MMVLVVWKQSAVGVMVNVSIEVTVWEVVKQLRGLTPED